MTTEDDTNKPPSPSPSDSTLWPQMTDADRQRAEALTARLREIVRDADLPNYTMGFATNPSDTPSTFAGCRVFNPMDEIKQLREEVQQIKETMERLERLTDLRQELTSLQELVASMLETLGSAPTSDNP